MSDASVCCGGVCCGVPPSLLASAAGGGLLRVVADASAVAIGAGAASVGATLGVMLTACELAGEPAGSPGGSLRAQPLSDTASVRPKKYQRGVTQRKVALAGAGSNGTPAR